MTSGGSARGARTRVGDFPALVDQARTWPAVLDALEGDVQEVEETLARGRADEIAAWGRRATDWIPPSNLGPLSADRQ